MELYTGRQWKCLPVPHAPEGQPAMHYTTVYRVFAPWADDRSLGQAFITSVRPLAAEQPLAPSVLQGDGTNTAAQKGAMAVGPQGLHLRRASRSLLASTILATS
jgi:hypothetical protein